VDDSRKLLFRRSPGVINLKAILAWGGGGDGASGTSHSGNSGGGGGGYGKISNYAVTSGQTIAVVVGGGGTRGTQTGNSDWSMCQIGGNGGGSSFGSLIATGGKGGTCNGGSGGSASGPGVAIMSGNSGMNGSAGDFQTGGAG